MSEEEIGAPQGTGDEFSQLDALLIENAALDAEIRAEQELSAIDEFVEQAPPKTDLQQREEAVSALSSSNQSPEYAPPGLSLQNKIRRIAEIEQQLGAVNDEFERLPLIVEKDELQAQLEVDINASKRLEQSGVLETLKRMGQRAGRDFARDAFTVAGAAKGAQIGAKVPGIAKVVTTPLGFVLGGFLSGGAAEVGLEKAGDVIAGEQPEDPTLLGAFGVGFAPQPQDDPNIWESFERGVEEAGTSMVLPAALRSARSFAEAAVRAPTIVARSLGQVITGSVETLQTRLGKEGAKNLTRSQGEFSEAVNTLAETGYIDFIRSFTKETVPSLKQLTAMAKGSGISRDRLKTFYNEVLNSFDVNLKTAHNGMIDMFGEAMRSRLSQVDQAAKNFKLQLEPNWNAIRADIYSQFPRAAQEEKTAKGVRGLKSLVERKLEAAEAAFKKGQRGGPVSFIGEELKNVYREINFARTGKKPKQEIIQRAIAKEYRRFIDDSALQVDNFFSSRLRNPNSQESLQLKQLGFESLESLPEGPGRALPGGTSPVDTSFPVTFEVTKDGVKRVPIEELEDPARVVFQFDEVSGNTNLSSEIKQLNKKMSALLETREDISKNLAASGALTEFQQHAKKASARNIQDAEKVGRRKGTLAGAAIGGVIGGASGTGLPGVGGGVAAGAVGGGMLGEGLYGTLALMNNSSKAQLRAASLAQRYLKRAGPMASKLKRNVVEMLTSDTMAITLNGLLKELLGPDVAYAFPVMDEQTQAMVLSDLSKVAPNMFDDPLIPGARSLFNGKLTDENEIRNFSIKFNRMYKDGEITARQRRRLQDGLNRDGSLLLDELEIPIITKEEQAEIRGGFVGAKQTVDTGLGTTRKVTSEKDSAKLED